MVYMLVHQHPLIGGQVPVHLHCPLICTPSHHVGIVGGGAISPQHLTVFGAGALRAHPLVVQYK